MELIKAHVFCSLRSLAVELVQEESQKYILCFKLYLVQTSKLGVLEWNVNLTALSKSIFLTFILKSQEISVKIFF